MKAINIEQKNQNPKIEYPILMELISSGLVVLFTDEYAKEWFFVRKANSGFELGYYSDGWMTTNEKYWRPYTGEIVLVNK